MHVDQVLDYGSRVTMKCKRGHELTVDAVPDEEHRTGTQYTPSELNRGIPCPTCADMAITKK
jgi:hypothetical protein